MTKTEKRITELNVVLKALRDARQEQFPDDNLGLMAGLGRAVSIVCERRLELRKSLRDARESHVDK